MVQKFSERFTETETDTVTVYGEAYGGKMQKMSKTYGPNLKFVAFEVKVGNVWLAVPQACEFVGFLGLDFVAYEEIDATIQAIDAERDRPSVQAVRNGITEPRIREGIVLRPPFEVRLNNGERVIAKHKRAEFGERNSTAIDMDPAQRSLLESAEAVAIEWITPMRLEHVIDALISERENKDVGIEDTGAIIKLMVKDVIRESAGEITDSKAVRKALGARAAKLFKARPAEVLTDG